MLQCNNFEINNLKIRKCNGDFGGGLHIASSNGKFSNVEFSDNTAVQYGVGIFTDQNCSIELYNTKIMNNLKNDSSGGGIFADGELIINGEKSLICNNIAKTNWGGIYNKGKTIINNCRVYNNKALQYSGGGVFIQGELTLNNAKIYDNWCNYYGGGVYCSSENGFIFN